MENPAFRQRSQQADLPIEVPASENKPRGIADPLEKPTWEEWQGMKVFRRLLRDYRVCRDSLAFHIWHWLHDCKDKFGRTFGPWSTAGYIAKKFGCKPQTVYDKETLLSEWGYLVWTKKQGSQKDFKVLEGIKEIPDNPQTELPFKVIFNSAPKGTHGTAECASRGIASMPPAGPKCALRGTPYKECNMSVMGSVNLPQREKWMIDKELERLRACLGECRELAEPEKSETIRALRVQHRNLLRERAGLPPIAEQAKPQKEERPVSSPSPDLPACHGLPGSPEWKQWFEGQFGSGGKIRRES